MRSDDVFHAANALVSVLGTVTADAVIPGVGTAVSGAGSFMHLWQRSGRSTPDLDDRLAADLDAALADPHLRLPPDGRVLIPQMIIAARPTPAAVMAARLDADALCTAMLATLTDVEHRAPAMQDAFRRVVVPIVRRLLDDPALTPTLQPAFNRATAESLAVIGDSVARVEREQHAQSADLAEIKAMVAALGGRVADARASGITDRALIDLARRIAADVEDPGRAFAELERAVEVAIRVQAEGAAGSNHGDVVDRVLEEVARLSREGAYDAAADSIDAALAQEAAESAARRVRLLSSGVEQEILRRNASAAAARLVARAEAEGKAAFNDLRALQDEWYVRGRDKGLNLDAEIAIELSRLVLTRAQGPDQRGAGQNNLGAALTTLGERESSTALLEQAVAAYRAALTEWTQDRVPLDWAMTQNNLGNALKALGERESGTVRLEEAVAAYRAALTERTRDRVPLDWAMTQNNLGNALRALGELESNTPRLEQAVAAYRAALTERTRDRVPLDWAMTQNNLGNALAALGELESGTAQLEQAMEAFQAGLIEFVQDRVPLHWARSQFNLSTVEIAFFDKTAGPAHLDRAEQHVRAALEVFTAAGASQYVDMAEAQLARIAGRRPN